MLVFINLPLYKTFSFSYEFLTNKIVVYDLQLYYFSFILAVFYCILH